MNTTSSESRLIHTLLPLANTVSWLNEVQPIAVSSIPIEHTEALKQLESLGLTYRRNRTMCALQRERLIRLVIRESKLAPIELQNKFISAYQFILSAETSLPNSSLETT